MGRRGPKPNFYRHTDGTIIDGLIRRTDGRFQAHGTNKTFGKDPTEAIRRYSQWKAAERHEKLGFDVPMTVRQAGQHGGLGGMIAAIEHAKHYREPSEEIDDIEVTVPTYLPAGAVWERLGEIIRLNPRLAAHKTGIEELGWLRNLRPPGPSAKLGAIGGEYLRKQPPLSTDTRKKAKAHWREFCKAVGVETLRDIEAQHIRRYRDDVYRAFDEGRSRTYVGHRFGHVKTIVNHARTSGIDQDECGRVLTLCAMLKPPPKTAVAPKPITAEQFQKLLSVCDAKWAAILLLSLNACLYASEVAAVKNDEIDLDKRTFVGNRRKTGVVRVAILWERTVLAIKRYRREHPHRSEFLFVSQNGAAYSPNHVRRNFARRRKEANVEVEFNQLRDGAYTAAVESGADVMKAQVLAGHAAGMKDHYVRRNPGMVEAACRAVEQHYFGTQGIETS